VVSSEIEETLDEGASWDPIHMIDKDNAERKAIASREREGRKVTL